MRSLPFASVVFRADARHAGSEGAKDPRSEAFHNDQHFAVARDDSLALAARDGGENLTHGCGRGHHEAGRDRVFRVRVKRPVIVDAANVAVDEAGADQSDLDSRTAQLRSNGICQSAQSKKKRPGVSLQAGPAL